ncbi:MAG: DUF3375 domain-containing protein [Ornithinimicrobium sp.]
MLTYDALSDLRERHAAWRLLRAQHAPLVLAFLGRVFVEENTRTLPMSDLVSLLDDELYAVRQVHGDDALPQSPTAYLTDWTSAGWLRMYYPADSDDPHVEATPALERAVSWVESLAERAFIGTESRLATLVDLLSQIVHGSESDPKVRLEQLHAERARLDEEIARAERGQVDVLGETAQRERYQQFSSLARELLADFREVEAKFRGLDRGMRGRIAAWDGSKGELLDEVLGDRNSITESDQGRSFHAFYDFLLSSQRQDELAELLSQVHRMPSLDPDPRVRRVHHDWLVAADRTQATVRQLSDQLRRFLDDRVWLENRRVMDLLRSIETTSLSLPTGEHKMVTELDALSPRLALPLERPLYSRPAQSHVDSAIGDDDSHDMVDTTALFAQQYVDHQRLAQQVRDALAGRSQVELDTILAQHPVEQGLAEVVAYLGLVEDGVQVVLDDETRAHVTWQPDDNGPERSADMPAVSYVRHGVHTPNPEGMP